MDIKNLLKNKLLQYIACEISKENMYKWVINMLHQMLNGDIFDLNYLEIYGIITSLSEVNDLNDLSCRKLVEQFIEVLSGTKSFSYTFAIQIPKKFAFKNLLQCKDILQKYALKKHLSKSELHELEIITQQINKTFCTINDLLEMQIIKLLKLGFDIYPDEEKFEFNLKSIMFICEDLSASLEHDFLEKIIYLLECYDGIRCFYTHINFRNGTGNISIQV